MSTDLSDFTGDETDEQEETGPDLELYTAGSGNGDWAYVVTGDESREKQGKHSGDTKQGFTTQLKAVVEGTEFLDDEYPNAEVTIFTPHDAVARLVEGEGESKREYQELYRVANANYNNNRRRWQIEHLPKEEDNPAQDLI